MVVVAPPPPSAELLLSNVICINKFRHLRDRRERERGVREEKQLAGYSPGPVYKQRMRNRLEELCGRLLNFTNV